MATTLIGQAFTYLVYIAIPFIAFWVFYERVPMFKRGVDGLMVRLSKKKKSPAQAPEPPPPVVPEKAKIEALRLEETAPAPGAGKKAREVYVLKKMWIVDEDE